MRTADILAALPKLEAEERQQIFERLCELQEHDLLTGAGGPPETEKALLDGALSDHDRDGDRGRPWCEVLGEL